MILKTYVLYMLKVYISQSNKHKIKVTLTRRKHKVEGIMITINSSKIQNYAKIIIDDNFYKIKVM